MLAISTRQSHLGLLSSPSVLTSLLQRLEAATITQRIEGLNDHLAICNFLIICFKALHFEMNLGFSCRAMSISMYLRVRVNLVRLG